MAIAKRTVNMADELLGEPFHVISVEMREKHGATGTKIIAQKQGMWNARAWILSLRNRFPFFDPHTFLGTA